MTKQEKAAAMFVAASKLAGEYMEKGEYATSSKILAAFADFPIDSAARLYEIITRTGQYAPAPLGATESITCYGSMTA